MELVRVEHEILEKHIVQGATKTHTVLKRGEKGCLYQQLSLSYNTGVVNITLHEPKIEGTEWQGATIKEALTVTILVDGQEVGTVDLVDGQGSFDFAATEPGTYIIEVQAELTASGRIEVTI
ncbi:MAG: hypothetical protein FH756_01495 [Firmicutes bacterium]|nr:hypothetical protein [Bacillota bacterium]